MGTSMGIPMGAPGGPRGPRSPRPAGGPGLWLASRGQRTEGTVLTALTTTGFTVYLGVFLGFFMLIQIDHSVWWIIGVIAIVKMCDTGAYFTGCSIGRHKMIPWLSPGKTWEGLAGGLLAAMGTAWGLRP